MDSLTKTRGSEGNIMFAPGKRMGPFCRNLLAGIAVVAFLGQTLPASSQFRPSHNINKPGNREGLATRGSGCQAQMSPSLTTLVPTSNLGSTIAPFPTFYWYMPENSYKIGSFTLYAANQPSAEDEPVYSASFRLSGKSGISGLPLPPDATMPSLKVGQDYRWKLTLICDPDEPSGNIFAEGWIQREQPSADLLTRLQAAQPSERHQVYAAAGYWYDALRELIVLRQANPQDTSLLEAWRALLESDAVQLNMISKQAENP